MQIQNLVNIKYLVVIHKAAGKQIKIKPGQKMDVNVAGGQIILSLTKNKAKMNWPEDHYKKLGGIWKSSEEIDKYLEEEDKSWE